MFFDTRHQIQKTLEALIHREHGEVPIFIAREITKTHEELLSGTVSEVYEAIKTRLEKDEPIGELTVVLKGFGPADQRVSVSLETLKKFRSSSTKEASKIAAEITGRSARDCYQALIEENE